MNSDASLFELLKPYIQSLGFPGLLLLIIAFTLRKVIIWAMPHLEDLVKAYISRQKTMEECQKQLTEETIKIQEDTRMKIESLRQDLKGICRSVS